MNIEREIKKVNQTESETEWESQREEWVEKMGERVELVARERESEWERKSKSANLNQFRSLGLYLFCIEMRRAVEGNNNNRG